MSQTPQARHRFLFVENNDEQRANLAASLGALGHELVVAANRGEALARTDLDEFDLIISDLADESVAAESDDARRRRLMVAIPANDDALSHANVKAFKIGVSSPRLRHDTDSLGAIIEKTLACNLRYIDVSERPERIHEKIDLELPSDLSLMTTVIEYLLNRVAKLGLVQPERSNLFVALDEAFVNAVKHGNKNDPSKLLRITAELSGREAIFTIEDEGEGFDVREIPDPCDPANLFKSSGRGVMLMYNIMDEVEYNTRGNKVKMVKRSLETPLNQSSAERDKRPHGR
jgi:serine/threonine-protein kinase RsbW